MNRFNFFNGKHIFIAPFLNSTGRRKFLKIWSYFNPFVPNALFVCPQKILRFSDVFRGQRNGALRTNGLKYDQIKKKFPLSCRVNLQGCIFLMRIKLDCFCFFFLCLFFENNLFSEWSNLEALEIKVFIASQSQWIYF